MENMMLIDLAGTRGVVCRDSARSSVERERIGGTDVFGAIAGADTIPATDVAFPAVRISG